jgi:hypothetical protein
MPSDVEDAKEERTAGLAAKASTIEGQVAPPSGTPGKEKGLQVVDLQAFWDLVALQGFEPRTCGL